jgi:hypothetical protein
LLLLSFSVVLLHGMVPHHHHHGVVPESSASCCSDQQNQCDADGNSQYCDAFNEISLLKRSVSRVESPQLLNSLFQVVILNEKLQVAERLTSDGHFVPRTILSTTCPEGRTISLRGPPPIV